MLSRKYIEDILGRTTRDPDWFSILSFSHKITEEYLSLEFIVQRYWGWLEGLSEDPTPDNFKHYFIELWGLDENTCKSLWIEQFGDDELWED